MSSTAAPDHDERADEERDFEEDTRDEAQDEDEDDEEKRKAAAEEHTREDRPPRANTL